MQALKFLALPLFVPDNVIGTVGRCEFQISGVMLRKDYLNSKRQRALTCRVIAVVPIFAAAIAVAAGNWFPVFTLETLQTI